MIRAQKPSLVDAAALEPDRSESVTAPEAPGQPRSAPRLRWLREVAIVVVFYGLYTAVRDINGTKPVTVDVARANALAIVHVERWLHVFYEQQLQAAVLHLRPLVSFLDDFYGTAHFAMVAAVLVLLYRRYPERYHRWRNTLALTTLLALIGFWVFPVMPPRLLPSSYHFVDTLNVIGGVWNFKSAPVNDVSNQFAAMPSLHAAWSTWCAAALIPLIRPLWGKLCAVAYPVVTVFCIVVTGNHFFADAFAGVVTVGLAYWLASVLNARVRHWELRRALRRGELLVT